MRSIARFLDRTIEAEVLGIGLGNQDLMTLRCEMTEGEAILVGVAAGIALIGTIKENHVLFLLFII